MVIMPVLVANDGTIVSMRFVESMNFLRNDPDLVIDRLKNDRVIKISTSSGKSYEISLNRQRVELSHILSLPDDNAKFEQHIFESWYLQQYQTKS